MGKTASLYWDGPLQITFSVILLSIARTQYIYLYDWYLIPMFYIHLRCLFFVDKKYTEAVKDKVEGKVVADTDDLTINTWAAYYRVLKGHVF